MKYYYFMQDGKESASLHNEADIVRKYKSGFLSGDTLIRESKSEPWVSILKLHGIFPDYGAETKPKEPQGYFYTIDGVVSQGPISGQELARKQLAGILSPITLIRKDEAERWVSIFTLEGTSPAPLTEPHRRKTPALQPTVQPTPLRTEKKERQGYFEPTLRAWKSIRRAIRMLAALGALGAIVMLAAAITTQSAVTTVIAGVNLTLIIGWFLCRKWAWVASVVLLAFGFIFTCFSAPNANECIVSIVAQMVALLILVLLLPGFGPKPEEPKP